MSLFKRLYNASIRDMKWRIIFTTPHSMRQLIDTYLRHNKSRVILVTHMRTRLSRLSSHHLCRQLNVPNKKNITSRNNSVKLKVKVFYFFFHIYQNYNCKRLLIMSVRWWLTHSMVQIILVQSRNAVSLLLSGTLGMTEWVE